MNIFEENRKKYEIKSKKDAAIMGLALLFGGGVVFIIGLPFSFIIIGIPFVIGGGLFMILGALLLLMSPFYKTKAK